MPGQQKEIVHLLPSELRLLPPGDKASPGSLELSNWRVDQAGVLRSRRGLTIEAAGFSGPFHTLFRWGSDRYGITGTNLHTGPAMGQYLATGFSGQPCTMLSYRDFVWIMDRSKPSKSQVTSTFNWSIATPTAAPTATAGGQLTTAIATFDSGEAWAVINPDGEVNPILSTTTKVILAGDDGTVAVANGSVNIVGTGTAFSAGWVGETITIFDDLASISSTIETVTDATHLTIADTMALSTGSALVYEIFSMNTIVFETKEFNAVNKTQGSHSLQINAAQTGKWTARLSGLSLSTMIAGGMRGDDEFRFQFYASDPSEVIKIAVTFLNGGAGSDDYMTAEIPGSALSPARYLWQELSINRGTASSDPFFDELSASLNAQYLYETQQENHAIAAIILSRLVERQAEVRAQQKSFDGSPTFNWSAITEIQIDVYMAGASTIHLDDAHFIGGVLASLNGDFYYAVSYNNNFGHETSIGPYSAAVTLDKQSVALTAIPVSPDPQVTSKHIYRIGGGVNVPRQVHTMSNAGTTWTDTVSVEYQQLNGVNAQLEVDPAPAAWGAVQHGGRIIAWKENRIYWSETAKPWSFPGSNDPVEGNWVDVGADGEDIARCTSHGNQLWIYKTKTIWRILGDPDQAGVDPEPTSAGFGALGLTGVVEAGNVDYFVTCEGVFVFNGDRAQKVSRWVDPLFKSDYPALTTTTFRSPAAQDTIDTAALGYINGRLYVSYPEVGQATPNRTLVMDVDSGSWYDHTGGFRCFFYEGQRETLLGGRQDGSIVSLEQGSLDLGSNIALRWQTAYLDQGAPDNQKRYSDLVIEYQNCFGSETGPASLSVTLLLDNGATAIGVGTIASATRAIATFTPALGTEWISKNFGLLVTGNTGKTVLIYAAYLHYVVLPRSMCSFDSGVTDLGTRLMKRIEAIEFDLESAGSTSLVWRMSTDVPGNAIAVRTNVTTPVAVGRRTITVPIAPGVADGRRIRFEYTSTGCPQLYGIRMRFRTDGDRFDGADGQVWASGIEDLGELNLFTRLEIVADTTGPVVVAFLTGFPGYDMAPRFSATFNTASTERQEIPFELFHATRGKLMQVGLAPGVSTVMKLFSVRVFARNFDRASGGGAWRWITLFSAVPDAAVNGERSTWVDLPL